MHNVNGYITAFHHAASRVVDFTADEMLDWFIVGLKPKIQV